MSDSIAIEEGRRGKSTLSQKKFNSPSSCPSSPPTPSSREHVPLRRAMLVLVICIVCIGCLASWIIIICTDLAAVLDVDQSTIGIFR